MSVRLVSDLQLTQSAVPARMLALHGEQVAAGEAASGANGRLVGVATELDADMVERTICKQEPSRKT